jgi:hypothetical protein
MNILDKFRRTTNYDLQVFFVDYDNFVSTSFQKLVAYYKGNSSVDKSVFRELNRLYKESLKIESTISSLHSSLSSTTEFWDLIETFSTLKVKLESMLNLAKWMRSSYVYGYENQSKFKYILKQRQTLENVSMEFGSADPNEDWVEMAVDNSVRELDYTKQGGNVLDLKKTDNHALNVTTVVDIMIGDNILGKDMTQKIEITADDITSLGTVMTMEQSAEICLTTTRGSVPEFPTLGISKHFVGSTVNALRLSSLLREVTNNFKTDDSFKSVQMVDNGINQDVAYYDFKIVSRLNNETNKTL